MAESKKAGTSSSAPQDAPQEQTETKMVEVPADLLERLLERLASEPNNAKSVEVTSEPNSVSLNSAGRTTGVINKYPIDPAYYPSPIDFLMGLPTLSKYNLPENYDLVWKVQGTTYETKYGTFVQEPRFILTLYRKMFDEDDKEIEGKKYLVKEGWFTEDEAMALTIAQDLGIDTSQVDLRGLLNQVRMKRFQQWIEEIFKPKKSLLRPATRKQTVIGGVPVIVEESEHEV